MGWRACFCKPDGPADGQPPQLIVFLAAEQPTVACLERLKQDYELTKGRPRQRLGGPAAGAFVSERANDTAAGVSGRIARLLTRLKVHALKPRSNDHTGRGLDADGL